MTKLVCSHRLFLAIFTLIGFMLIFSLRVGLSIAIISMVNHTAVDSLVNFNDTFDNISDKESNILVDGQHVWDREIQGHILGAFFYGYFTFQLASGWLAEKYGCRRVIFVLFGIAGIATILTPLAVELGGYVFLIIMRIIAGVGSSGAYPVMLSFWSKWAPENERSKLTNINFSGSHLGIVLTLSQGGFLCSTIGWESIFYISGGSLCVWVLLWYYFVSDCPSQAKFISEAEKTYLTWHITNDTRKIQPKCPWSSLLSSPQVWGLMIVAFCSDWGYYTFLTNTPTYLSDVLGVDITSNGLFSALPYLGAFLALQIVPHIADYIISKKHMSIRAVRIMMTSISSSGIVLFLIGITFTNASQHLLVVAFLTLMSMFGTVSNSGHLINPLDFAPEFAGTIMGLVNGFAALSGFLAPIVVGTVTKHQTIREWRIVFYVTAVFYMFGTICFAITCRGKILNWACVTKNPDESSNGESLSLNKEI